VIGIHTIRAEFQLQSEKEAFQADPDTDMRRRAGEQPPVPGWPGSLQEARSMAGVQESPGCAIPALPGANTAGQGAVVAPRRKAAQLPDLRAEAATWSAGDPGVQCFAACI
jgi:hypothetical protein